MKSIIYLLIFLVIAVNCQVIVHRNCPLDRHVVTDFDLNKYLGRWYEISRYDQPYQKGGDCSFATYTLNEDGSVKVNNSHIILPSVDRTWVIGRAVLSYPDASPLEAKLNVTFGQMPPIFSNYWILDTDYNHYAIIYGCHQISDNNSADSAWVLSRTAVLDTTVQSHVDEVVDKYFIRSEMRITNQNPKDCLYE